MPFARPLSIMAVVTATAALLAGCGPLDATGQVLNRSELVNELASRLDQATGLTYTAEYELADGTKATITQVQEPVRASYTYPGGRFAITPEATIDCRGTGEEASCTLTAPPKPKSDTTAMFTAMRERGLVPPQLVIGLLTTASLSDRAAISTSTRTIAGQPATCVHVTGLTDVPTPDFVGCITGSGVLGSFDGTLDDRETDVELVSYRDQAATDAFDTVDGAKTVDERPSP